MSAGPDSLWHAMSGQAAPRAQAAGESCVDLLVVGGGFTGLSTALHAAEAGLNVALVEAKRIAGGASGRNAGFVVPNFALADPEMVIERLGPEKGRALNMFAAGSSDLVFDLIRRHGIDCDAWQSGWIQPAHSAAALERTVSRARQWAALGRPAEVLGAQAVAQLTGAEGYLGGWTDHSGGTVNPVAYALGLAQASETAGASVCEDSPVLGLERSGEFWSATMARATVRARRVVLATNAQPGALMPALAQSVYPLRVFQIATEPLPLAVRHRLLPGGQCVSDTRRNLFTFRFDAGNRLITGGMHIWGPGAERRVPARIHRRLAAMLNLPDLPPISHAWSGIAAVVPDYLPRIFAIDPGLVAGLACNGRGIAMTTRLGQVLADWASGTPLDAVPVPSTPLAPIRLHALARHAPNMLLPVSILRDRLDAVSAGRTDFKG